MRQYGEVPPWLSTAAAPKVSATTGLGTGGGAGVSTPDGQGFGNIIVQSGSNPSTGGTITLIFPEQPPVLFFGSSDPFGTLTATDNDGAHTTIVLNWTAKLPISRKLLLTYEWANSQ